jgi:3-phenylpropionate/cinnamic acid dioxygenase small subunit
MLSTTLDATYAQVCDLLHREARLLDGLELEPWLELFLPDAVYCSPLGATCVDGEPVILLDDDRLRRQRVFRLLQTPAYAQRPASRTVRQVSNVEVDLQPDGQVAVECVVVIHEVRVGDERQYGLGTPRVLPTRTRYVLRPVADGTLRIARKEVVLLMREAPLENLSILL